MPHLDVRPPGGIQARAGSGRRADFLVILLLLGVGTALWLPVLDSGPVTDDYRWLEIAAERGGLETGASIGRVAGLFGLFLAGREEGERYGHRFYRPVVVATHALQTMTTGFSPRPLMAVNLGIHLLNGILIFLLARALVRAPAVAAGLATGIFLASPLAVEPVAWICDRSDTLSLAFGLAALLARTLRPRGWLLPALFLFLSLCSKEHGLIYAPLLALLDLARAEGTPRSRARTALLAAWPWVLAVAAWFVLRGIAIGFFATEYASGGLGEKLSDPELITRYGGGARALLAPFDALAMDGRAWRIAAVAVAVLQAALGVAGAVALWRRSPALAAIPIALLLFTFLLGLTFHGVTPMLLNARLLYTPLAAWVLSIAAAAIPASTARWARVAIGLVFVAVAAHLPTQLGAWVSGYDDAQRLIGSMRAVETARDVPAADRLALLGYHDVAVMNGAYDLSADVQLAMREPFFSPSTTVVKVAPIAAPQRETLGALLRSASASRTVFAAMSPPDTRPPFVEAVHRGALGAPGALELASPAGGASFAIDEGGAASGAAGGRDASVAFDFLERLPAGARLRLGMMHWGARLFLQELPEHPVESLPGGARRHVIALPLAAAADLVGPDGRLELGWWIEAQSAEGDVLARTAPRLLVLTTSTAPR